MEVSMDVLSLCVVAAVATVFLTWLLNITTAFSPRRRSKTAKKQKLPPGPWTLPVIGSLHHVINTVPHRAFAALSRRYGPVMLVQLGELPTVVVSSAEAAALIMKTHDLVFANRAHSVTLDIFSSGGIGFGFSPYGDRWRNLRKACVAALLSAKHVKQQEGIRAEEVGKLLRSITTRDGGAVVNLSHRFSALTTSITSRAMFSDRCSQQQQDAFIQAMDKVVRLLGGFALVDIFPSWRLVRWFSDGEREMKKSIGHIQDIISEIIRDRKATDTDNEDVLDALLGFQEEQDTPLAIESLGAAILELFTGGTETSASVLGWAMSELFNNPRIMAKAQSEVRQVLGPDHQGVISNADLGQLPFLQMVIKEALRTHPPAPILVPRETREDCNIMGYDIPKGTTVSVNVFAISRDPRFWENPDEFMPERFENSNIDYYGTHFQFTPFGAGRRQCPGILFAESVIQLALANLLYHFDWVHPGGIGAADQSLDMSEIHGLSGGRRFDLELIAIPHVFTSTAA